MEPRRVPPHLVGVALNDRPVDLADAVDHLGRTRAAADQITANNDGIRCVHPDVSDHCIERGEIGVNIR